MRGQFCPSARNGPQHKTPSLSLCSCSGEGLAFSWEALSFLLWKAPLSGQALHLPMVNRASRRTLRPRGSGSRKAVSTRLGQGPRGYHHCVQFRFPCPTESGLGRTGERVPLKTGTAGPQLHGGGRPPPPALGGLRGDLGHAPPLSHTPTPAGLWDPGQPRAARGDQEKPLALKAVGSTSLTPSRPHLLVIKASSVCLHI